MNENGLVLKVERVVPAAPEEVFGALTRPEQFARWMGPEGSAVGVEEMNPTPGAGFAFDVDVTPQGPRFRLYGTYRQVEAPYLLSHSWATEGEDGETEVTFEIKEHGGGSLVTLTQNGLVDQADLAQNEAGWSHQLDRLEGLFK